MKTPKIESKIHLWRFQRKQEINLRILLLQGLFCSPHSFSSEAPVCSAHTDIFSYTVRIRGSFQFFSFPPAFAESASRHSVRGAA